MFDKEITESRANEVALRFGFLSIPLYNLLRRITMYLVRIEDKCQVRNYYADNYFDASELFNALSKTFHFIQLWKGSNLVSEYKN